ncbi:MAG: hypothetical protein FWD98_02540 [Defluviitaleaceae bacterium]|nr:hypothetical protein [Defluviitaleaceae bacterium]
MKKLQAVGFRQQEVTVDGVTYVIQKIPFKSYLEMEDRCTSRYGILQKMPYLTELFNHCVVSPKVSLADFDDNFGAANDLANEVERFLKSKPKQDADQEESQG